MTRSIRLIAIDIDGTLLDSRSQVSPANLEALQRAQEAGTEIVLVTGRRHQFALPIAESLGFPLWIISSNGAVTRSTSGESFHRDLMPLATACKICRHMPEFRDYMVITFDREGRGAIVCENHERLYGVIQRWMEKNSPYIEYISPLETSLTNDPIQVMFCGPVELMRTAQQRLMEGDLAGELLCCARNTIIAISPSSMFCTPACSKGHALERWAAYRGIPRSQVMAIGDNYNDIAMLTFAGIR